MGRGWRGWSLIQACSWLPAGVLEPVCYCIPPSRGIGTTAPVSSARCIYFSKLLGSRLSTLVSWLETKVHFPFLPSWETPKYCIYQFVLLSSVFPILRQMLKSGSGQWKLARWLHEQSLELQFGAPFGACIILVWADRPSFHLLLTSCSLRCSSLMLLVGCGTVGTVCVPGSSFPSEGKEHPWAATCNEIP